MLGLRTDTSVRPQILGGDGQTVGDALEFPWD